MVSFIDALFEPFECFAVPSNYKRVQDEISGEMCTPVSQNVPIISRGVLKICGLLASLFEWIRLSTVFVSNFFFKPENDNNIVVVTQA